MRGPERLKAHSAHPAPSCHLRSGDVRTCVASPCNLGEKSSLSGAELSLKKLSFGGRMRSGSSWPPRAPRARPGPPLSAASASSSLLKSGGGPAPQNLERERRAKSLLFCCSALEVDSGALLHFWGAWDLIAGELTTAAHPNPEPSAGLRAFQILTALLEHLELSVLVWSFGFFFCPSAPLVLKVKVSDCQRTAPHRQPAVPVNLSVCPRASRLRSCLHTGRPRRPSWL